MFWQFYHHIKINDSFNDTTYWQWFRKKISLWVSNAQSVYHASVTTVTTNSQGEWHTVHCYLHVKNPQTETDHCSYRNRPTLEKSNFTLKHGFTSMTRRDKPAPVCANIRPWHRKRLGNISMTMLQVRSKFFRKKSTKLQTHLHVDASWVNFRWPCHGISRVWQKAVVIHAVFASSSWIRQSKLPKQNVRPESGRCFLWCKRVLVS